MKTSVSLMNLWQGRDDRYSELRSSQKSASPTSNGKRRVEMSYIGG